MDGGGGGKKIQKTNVDRISSLPDEVLSHILSLLSTKCAVGTSILSNRWKYLWTFITCLHFEAKDSYYSACFTADYASEDENDSYLVEFVDHVFARCSSSRIEKLILHLYHHLVDESRVKAWIDEAIKRNVSEMDINVSHLPLSVLRCRTLTVLTLGGRCDNDPDIPLFDLPCLKVLHIQLLCSDKDFMEKLIKSCPVLKDLTLEGSLLDLGYVGGDSFMISSPALRTLWMQLCPTATAGTDKISINCPNLEYLHLSESFVYYSIKGDLSPLVMANMDIADIFSCRRRRHHSLSFLKETYSCTLPKFDNLTCLKLTILGNLFWKMLPKLLRSSPCLEELSLEQRKHEHEQGNYKSDLPGECDWVEPKFVHKCLRSRLAVIKIVGFRGSKRELQLLKYFLCYAKVLQWLKINCQGLTQAEETDFCVQILKFSRASKFCEVRFNGDFISNL